MGRSSVAVVACLCLFGLCGLYACSKRSGTGSTDAGAAGAGGAAAGGSGGAGTGAAGTAGTVGAAGGAGTPGTAGTTGAAGLSGVAGTTGTGGRGGTTGTGGRGGTTGSGGGGTTGSAGTTGGGGGGTTGSAGATGGAGTTGAAGGTGGSPTAMQIAAVLDGQKWLVPCGRDESASNLVCEVFPPGVGTTCPSRPVSNAPWPSGYSTRSDRITFGGTPGKTYDVTVRIRGIVEVAVYQNGMKDPAQDGWYIGGELTPKYGDGFNGYNVYALTVSSPVVVPSALGSGQFYFLNAVNQRQAHYSYAIDYTVTIPIDAGAEVGFVANSLNCRAVKNCDATSVEHAGGNMPGCNPITLADLPASAGITQPYVGQFMVMNVVSAVAR